MLLQRLDQRRIKFVLGQNLEKRLRGMSVSPIQGFSRAFGFLLEFFFFLILSHNNIICCGIADAAIGGGGRSFIDFNVVTYPH
jgi:hypothetical protein